MAGGGSIKASANMWALLSDNDPGHSEAAAVEQRLDDGKARGKGPAAGDKRQAVASGEPESSGVGGDAARHDREYKQARVERNKEQKKPPPPANREASTSLTAGECQSQTTKGPAPMMISTNGEAEDGDGGYSSGQSDSDEEDEGGAAAAGGSSCRKLLCGLFNAAVVISSPPSLSMSLRRLLAPPALQPDRRCCQCIST
jgi:hypothetical protein